jgi:hypothetical protein
LEELFFGSFRNKAANIFGRTKMPNGGNGFACDLKKTKKTVAIQLPKNYIWMKIIWNRRGGNGFNNLIGGQRQQAQKPAIFHSIEIT